MNISNDSEFKAALGDLPGTAGARSRRASRRMCLRYARITD